MRNKLCDDCGKLAKNNYINKQKICISCGSATSDEKHPFCGGCYRLSLNQAVPAVPLGSVNAGQVSAPSAGPTIMLWKTKFEVKSGKTVTIPAYISDTTVGKKGEKKKNGFLVQGSNGEIDYFKGVYKAPVVDKDTKEIILVVCANDSSIQPKEAEITILAAKKPIIRISQSVYEVQSGKKIKINPYWDNVIGEKFRFLFEMQEGKGTVDDQGWYEAPLTTVEKEVKVRVFTTEKFCEKDIDSATAVIRIKPAEIIQQRNAKAISGSKITFERKAEFSKYAIRWEVVDNSPDTGSINPDSGEYAAPELIKEDRDVTIRAIDLGSGEKDDIVLKLLAIRIIETAPQARLNARSGKVRLKIKSDNDILGEDNFTCKVLRSPNGWFPGSVTEGGWYTPPPSVSAVEKVKIEAQSKADKSKKLVIEFEVGFPMCPKCKKEMAAGYVCPSCGYPEIK